MTAKNAVKQHTIGRARLVRRLALPLALVATLVFAGCVGTQSNIEAPDPREGEDHRTDRTIHLKIQVVDYDQTIYPGLDTWLWAFCVEPFDSSDTVSAAAIEYSPRLAGDGTNHNDAVLKEHCGVPAPTIRVQQGDRVIVEFTNNHIHPHTIHWHGQRVPVEMDGAQGTSQQAVPKGGSFTYDFIAKRAGTLWYHCHVDAGFHVAQGLHGMFIVEPANKEHEPAVDHEETLTLGTLRRANVEAVPGASRHDHQIGFISGTPGYQNPPQDLEPDVFTINGHSYPLTEEHRPSMVHIKEGTSVRVRMLNAGTTTEEIHLHGHDMYVFAQDGVRLASPYWVDTLRIGPAERFDFLIHGDNPGVWMLHTHRPEGETNDMQFPGGMHTMLVYEGFEDQMHAFPQEKPGGFPYMPDVEPPVDRTFADTIFVGAGAAPPVPGLPAPSPAVRESRPFVVEMACAVKSITFVARLDGSAAAMNAAQLRVNITDPLNRVRLNEPLGLNQASPGTPKRTAPYADAQNETSSGVFTLPTGNWTVSVGGTGAQVVVSLSTHIDYYASWDEQRASHHLLKTPICGPYGFGSQGRVVGSPPP